MKDKEIKEIQVGKEKIVTACTYSKYSNRKL